MDFDNIEELKWQDVADLYNENISPNSSQNIEELFDNALFDNGSDSDLVAYCSTTGWCDGDYSYTFDSNYRVR